MKTIINILSCSILLLFASCESGFEPINYGGESCANCKMTIVDYRFAAEMVTEKGRVYKFDDITCMRLFSGYHEDLGKNAQFFVAGFTGKKDEFMDATKAVYLHNDFFTSPMSGNYAAFLSNDDAGHLKDSLGSEPISWVNIK